MKKYLVAGALALVMAFGSSAAAQEAAIGSSAPPAAGGAAFKPFVVGGFMSLGMAHWVGDNDDMKPRFAGGGGAYFDFYLNPMFALEGGIGFVGTGWRMELEDATGADVDGTYRLKFVNMEIPLGVKINIRNFQIGAGVALHFVLSGKEKAKSDDDESSSSVSGDDWDNFHRANVAPKITLAYAIPVGPVAIVPGVSWFINLVDDTKDTEDDDCRSMNLMFNVGAEFGFGG